MCVTRCIHCAINILLPVALGLWAASMGTPGWQKIESPNGMKYGVGLFYSVCIGFTNSSDMSFREKVAKAFKQRETCFAKKDRESRKAYEHATIVLTCMSGLALLFCWVWGCVTCIACCCTRCLTMPLIIAAACAAGAAAIGVAVFFTQADTPEEFVDIAKEMIGKLAEDADWRDKTRLWYSGYLMIGSAFFSAVVCVLAVIKALCAKSGESDDK